VCLIKTSSYFAHKLLEIQNLKINMMFNYINQNKGSPLFSHDYPQAGRPIGAYLMKLSHLIARNKNETLHFVHP